jgi:hypothetical protein
MSTRFVVRTQADAGSLVRLLDPFAQRGLSLAAVRADAEDDDLDVVIELPALTETVAANIRARMLNLPSVRSVVVVEGDRASPDASPTT